MAILLAILGAVLSFLFVQNKKLKGKLQDQTTNKEIERVLTNEKNIRKLGDTFKSMLEKYRSKQ